MKFRLFLLLIPITSSALAFAATEQLKPGLWTMTINMQMAGMPQLSDDDIAQMRQMGIELPFVPGKPATVQQCITPEQATLEKPIDHYSNPDDQCSVKNYRRNGNSVSGDMVCTGDMKAQGRFVMTVNSNTSFSGKWALKGVTRDGLPIDQSSDIHARWMQAKCDPALITPAQ
ncbi:hypothetical protein MTYP_02615 [Methylophilaceae bacterium]|nr:hypothetical protein MTYP_02615 [Methylophilaceae bacterium]